MLMDIIKARHSIRKYTDEQISREDMEKVMEAGNFAPNAGGGQTLISSLYRFQLSFLCYEFRLKYCADRSNLAGSYVSKEQPSAIDDPTIKNGFYGAPSVVAVFGQNGFSFREADAFCCAENMVLQATELGIASCIISRGSETFLSAEGQKLLKKWEIPENYSAVCFVILGYIDGEQPHTKPRKAGRVRIIE